MIPIITPIYAGFLSLLLVALSARVIRHRYVTRISIGDRNSRELRKKMRVQANFIEYAPFGLVLLALAELQGLPEMALHILGSMLLLGRLAHAAGMGATPQRMPLRAAGMVLTLGMLILTAIANIALAMI
ncbi:MAG: MAPEG family protein [Rhodobacteraceae bacterium]|jgi:uncharacterized membrane protein YecN with MAPEG domain|nr:MAPEG family protein [Paracoccaceae bacterium]